MNLEPNCNCFLCTDDPPKTESNERGDDNTPKIIGIIMTVAVIGLIILIIICIIAISCYLKHRHIHKSHGKLIIGSYSTLVCTKFIITIHDVLFNVHK